MTVTTAWYTVKEKGKRQDVASAQMAMLTVCTPHLFLSTIWPELLATNSGLADRILSLYHDGKEVSYEQAEEHPTLLDESPLKSLGSVYEQIYSEHHAEVPIKYRMSASAKETFYNLDKVDIDTPADPTTVSTQDDSFRFCPSKRNKNVLLLAVNLHILYHRLTKALQQLVEPTPEIIPESILEMAISAYEICHTYGGLASIVSNRICYCLLWTVWRGHLFQPRGSNTPVCLFGH